MTERVRTEGSSIRDVSIFYFSMSTFTLMFWHPKMSFFTCRGGQSKHLAGIKSFRFPSYGFKVLPHFKKMFATDASLCIISHISSFKASLKALVTFLSGDGTALQLISRLWLIDDFEKAPSLFFNVSASLKLFVFTIWTFYQPRGGRS